MAATAMIPFVMFPVSGLLTAKEVAQSYMNPVIFLFLGGFMLAFAIEKWNLHKRIAYKLILSLPATPGNLLLGFMLVSWFMSMWMSNTATVLMLLPALVAVLAQIDESKPDSKPAIAFLLGLAYAGSIGGTATLIGTPPNIIFLGFFKDRFPGSDEITFTKWLLLGIPISLLMFAVGYFILRTFFIRDIANKRVDTAGCALSYRELGPMCFEEKAVGIIFLITALLWIFREDLDLGSISISGWSNIFTFKDYITDGTVAIGMGLLLFIIPSGEKPHLLLTWEEMKKLPYGILILFGGGFALAAGIDRSGFADFLVHQVNFLHDVPPILIVIALTTFMIFFTEMTSNVAATQIMLPFVFALASSIATPPLMFLLPVTFAASYAFMLPVATAPNAIVYSTERVPIRQMLRVGFLLNIAGIIILSLLAGLWGRIVFNF